MTLQVDIFGPVHLEAVFTDTEPYELVSATIRCLDSYEVVHGSNKGRRNRDFSPAIKEAAEKVRIELIRILTVANKRN